MYRIFSLLLTAALVIIGLQIPSVVNQYEQNLAAHLSEVTNNLAGFQRIADEYHRGSLSALIETHENSIDPTFRAEARVISDMYERQLRFENALAGLRTHLAGRLFQFATRADPEIRRETLASFTYTITINQDSLIGAGVLTLCGVILSDLSRFLFLSLVKPRSRSSSQAQR